MKKTITQVRHKINFWKQRCHVFHIYFEQNPSEFLCSAIAKGIMAVAMGVCTLPSEPSFSLKKETKSTQWLRP